MYGIAAGCHSPVAVSGSDGNAFAEKSIETVNPLFLYKGILLYSAGKRQSTSWSCYCHNKMRQVPSETITQPV